MTSEEKGLGKIITTLVIDCKLEGFVENVFSSLDDHLAVSALVVIVVF